MTHLCHAIGCEKPIPPRLLLCSRHWNALPSSAQRIAEHHYRPGQEAGKSPSAEYLLAAGCAVALASFLCHEIGERTALGRIAIASKGARLRGMAPDRIEETVRAMGCEQIARSKSG